MRAASFGKSRKKTIRLIGFSVIILVTAALVVSTREQPESRSVTAVWATSQRSSIMTERVFGIVVFQCENLYYDKTPRAILTKLKSILPDRLWERHGFGDSVYFESRKPGGIDTISFQNNVKTLTGFDPSYTCKVTLFHSQTEFQKTIRTYSLIFR